MDASIEKVSIIVSKGSLEGIYPALIMANGARAEGIEASRVSAPASCRASAGVTPARTPSSVSSYRPTSRLTRQAERSAPPGASAQPAPSRVHGPQARVFARDRRAGSLTQHQVVFLPFASRWQPIPGSPAD